MNTPELTLFFDGKCPFCAAEVTQLRKWNTAGKLGFIDISEANFDPAPLGVDMAALDRELHSQLTSGEILVGIDSMLATYTLIGKSWMVAPLRIKLLRPLMVALYRKFAQNRHRLSRLMGYKTFPSCEEGVCNSVNPFLDK